MATPAPLRTSAPVTHTAAVSPAFLLAPMVPPWVGGDEHKRTCREVLCERESVRFDRVRAPGSHLFGDRPGPGRPARRCGGGGVGPSRGGGGAPGRDRAAPPARAGRRRLGHAARRRLRRCRRRLDPRRLRGQPDDRRLSGLPQGQPLEHRRLRLPGAQELRRVHRLAQRADAVARTSPPPLPRPTRSAPGPGPPPPPTSSPDLSSTTVTAAATPTHTSRTAPPPQKKTPPPPPPPPPPTNPAPPPPPMGLRLRLKASYDISTLTGQARVIARALQVY